MSYQDTIKEILSFGGEDGNEYTLIEYIKGGEKEWNVAHWYNRETKSWAAGNYCYSLESALATCLMKMNSQYVKSEHQIRVENEYGISYYRLEELATQFKDGMELDNYDEAMIYYEDTCDLTSKEREFFGISELTDDSDCDDEEDDYDEE